MPRVWRASLLGAAALLIGPGIGTALAYLAPGLADRIADYTIRGLDAWWNDHYQPL